LISVLPPKAAFVFLQNKLLSNQFFPENGANIHIRKKRMRSLAKKAMNIGRAFSLFGKKNCVRLSNVPKSATHGCDF
jgi:hypothetical protein